MVHRHVKSCEKKNQPKKNIDDSWGDIMSRAKRDKRRTSLAARLGEDIRRREKTIDAPRAARRRNSIHASRSPYESCRSQKRTADISRAAKSRYPNVHSRDFPSRLRQTLPRATDPPLSLKYDPATTPKTKAKEDMDRAPSVLLTKQGGKMGNVEIGHVKLVDRTIFALRGFGEFEVLWGLGHMGKIRMDI